jgi:hypothetical protein
LRIASASFYDQTAGRYYEPVNVYYDDFSKVIFPDKITSMPGKTFIGVLIPADMKHRDSGYIFMVIPMSGKYI